MVLLPISDYPAPCDERSQMQVLGEQKGEIRQKAQAVSQSGLDRDTKRAVTNKLRAQAQGVDKEIRQKQFSKEYKHKLAEKEQQDGLEEKKALSKQQAGAVRARLDTRA